MPDTSDTSDTNTTRVRHKRDTSDTSATWTTRVWHECCPNYTNATRVRNFNFDNYTIFAPLYLPYSKWKMTRTGKISFWELLSMPKCVWKVHHKKWTLVMAKAISKSYKVDCGCKCAFTFPHSYGASFLKKYFMWHYEHFFCKN